jgi:hypothetical protein
MRYFLFATITLLVSACFHANSEDTEYTYFKDADGDRFGDPTVSIVSTEQTPPDGYVDNGLDCDDTDIQLNTDCADSVLEQFSWYPDIDEDGYGDMNATAVLSTEAPGSGSWVKNNEDCDDTDSALNTDCPLPEPTPVFKWKNYGEVDLGTIDLVSNVNNSSTQLLTPKLRTLQTLANDSYNAVFGNNTVKRDDGAYIAALSPDIMKITEVPLTTSFVKFDSTDNAVDIFTEKMEEIGSKRYTFGQNSIVVHDAGQYAKTISYPSIDITVDPQQLLLHVTASGDIYGLFPERETIRFNGSTIRLHHYSDATNSWSSSDILYEVENETNMKVYTPNVMHALISTAIVEKDGLLGLMIWGVEHVGQGHFGSDTYQSRHAIAEATHNLADSTTTMFQLRNNTDIIAFDIGSSTGWTYPFDWSAGSEIVRSNNYIFMKLRLDKREVYDTERGLLGQTANGIGSILAFDYWGNRLLPLVWDYRRLGSEALQCVLWGNARFAHDGNDNAWLFVSNDQGKKSPPCNVAGGDPYTDQYSAITKFDPAAQKWSTPRIVNTTFSLNFDQAKMIYTKKLGPIITATVKELAYSPNQDYSPTTYADFISEYLPEEIVPYDLHYKKRAFLGSYLLYVEDTYQLNDDTKMSGVMLDHEVCRYGVDGRSDDDRKVCNYSAPVLVENDNDEILACYSYWYADTWWSELKFVDTAGEYWTWHRDNTKNRLKCAMYTDK